MIVLTSFVEARRMDVDGWSGARWAPDFAREWPVAAWAQPFYPSGVAIKLRDFGDEPLPKYRDYVLGLYRKRWPQIKEWLGHVEGMDVALCCWCPYTKTAKRQLEHFGTFHCHLGVVGEVLDGAGVEWEYGTRHREEMI